jgi:Icc-related predicted phosphoesterase
MPSKILLTFVNFIYFLRDLLKGRVRVVDVKHLSKLKEKCEKLQKENDEIMVELYSTQATERVMNEIREILNCPAGCDIVEAIRRLKNE